MNKIDGVIKCENCKSENIKIGYIKRTVSIITIECKDCTFFIDFQEVFSDFRKEGKIESLLKEAKETLGKLLKKQ